MTNEEIIRGIIRQISAFSNQCEIAEYTDTREAWQLLDDIKADLQSIVPKEGPRQARGKARSNKV